MRYRVTASALNLRAEPTTKAARLDVLRRDAIVAGIDDASTPAGWRKVDWNTRTGFASATYLEAFDGASSVPAAAPFGAVSAAVSAAPPPTSVDRDPAKLHPAVRENILKTVSTLNAEGLPFRIFEAFRTPERQTWLYAQGRTRAGAVVTKSEAWESMHQYGLAADLVLFTGGQWSWGGKPTDWSRMHEVARTNGLKPLSWEKPHIEPENADWRAYQRGDLPDGGDETWLAAVGTAAERWRRSAKRPAAPPLRPGERPPLEE